MNCDYIITISNCVNYFKMGILMTPQKPTIIKEFDIILKDIARGNPHYAELIEPRLKSAIQNTMKELKKKVFISTSLSKQESNEVIKWSDVEKSLGKVE